MDFKYHLGSYYSKCGSVDHERLSPLGVQNCSPTPAETDLNLHFNKMLCWFSVWEVPGKISDSLICLWLTIRSTFSYYNPVGMYAHTHSSKSLWNSFLSFRNLDGNQWNNFIVWCADCKRSLAEVLTLGTTDISSQIVLGCGCAGLCTEGCWAAPLASTL